MSDKTVENKVNSTCNNICLQNEFPSFVRKSFLASNTDLPKFYHLIKTHKTGPDIKIRPIVSNLNGPTQRISWLLANALKPMLKNVPAHQQNATISMQPRYGIFIHFNTHTGSHHQCRRSNSEPNTPSTQTRHNRPSHSHAKQHVLLL